MRRPESLLLGFAICMMQPGCVDSETSELMPEELHESCIAVFERKGGPAELGERMCDSMRKACESNPSGEDCEKARRIVTNG